MPSSLSSLRPLSDSGQPGFFLSSKHPGLEQVDLAHVALWLPSQPLDRYRLQLLERVVKGELKSDLPRAVANNLLLA